MKQMVLALLLFSYSGVLTDARACTIWSATGEAVEGGGTLLAKNRDWIQEGVQKLVLEDHANGRRIFAIRVTGGTAAGLSAGINNKGLVVVNAAASSMPRKERLLQPRNKKFIETLLEGADDVTGALPLLKGMRGARFLILADRTRIVSVEMGSGDREPVITEKASGCFFHTNHYVVNELLEFNRPGCDTTSSRARFDRMGELLDVCGKRPLRMDDFIIFSHDQNAGPDNSLFRTGSSLPESVRTLATWIVRLPPEGSPEILVRFFGPDSTMHETHLKTDDVFSGKIIWPPATATASH